MRVSIDIRRSDLIKLSAYLLFLAKPNLIFFAIVTIMVFVFNALTTDVSLWLGLAIVSIAVGVISLLACFILSLLLTLFSSSYKNGVLGTHVYTINDQGIHESTCANEGLQRWSGIKSVQKSSSFIYIQINPYLFHLIPRRYFDTKKEFDEFGKKAHGYWKQEK